MAKPVTYSMTSAGIVRHREDVEVLILNTSLKLLAYSEDKKTVLLEVAGKGKFLVDLEDINSKPKFISLIRPFSFTGSPDDVEGIFLLLNAQLGSHPPTLVVLNLTGRIKQDGADFWILADRIIWWAADGQLLTEYFEGEFLIKQFGDKLFYINPSSVDAELKVQYANRNPEAKDVTLETLMEIWLAQYGSPALLYAILGYFAACMYMPEVIECRGAKFFPLMAVIGGTKSGKTSLLNLAFKFWGVDYVGNNYTQVSPFVETKQMTQASCIPIWRDEYRAEGFGKSKEGIIRSLYTRSAISKGTASQDLKHYMPVSTLFLSGEDVIIDPALRRRFVVFNLAEKHKLPFNIWQEVLGNSDTYFSEFFFRFLENGFDKKVFRRLYQQEMKSANDQGEEKILYAALGAVSSEAIGQLAIDTADLYWREILGDGEEDDVTEQEDNVEAFFSFLLIYLRRSGWLRGKTFGDNRIVAQILDFSFIKKGDLRLDLKTLVDIAYRAGFKEQTNIGQRMLSRMIRERYGGERRTMRFGNRVCLGIVFNIKTISKFSPNLKILCQNLALIQKEEMQDNRHLTLGLLEGYEDLPDEEYEVLEPPADPDVIPF